jgi:phospholipase C
MNSVGRICCLMLLASSFATFAYATTYNTPLQHVIILIQENRTPDNLFYGDQTLVDRGGDVRPPGNQGACTKHGGNQPVAFVPWQLDACFSPGHGHGSWKKMYNLGDMDGACKIIVNYDPNSGCDDSHLTPQCPQPDGGGPCPHYTFVDNPTILNPYFVIANNYGFGNRFFQTNQGPSFPAHQFLLAGTSAPVAFSGNDPINYYKWFVAENPGPPNTDAGSRTGCTAPSDVYARTIDTGSAEAQSCPSIHNAYCPATCYDHNTLVDVLKTGSSVTWKYYGVGGHDMGQGSIWTAPNAIVNLCRKRTPNSVCNDPDWANVVFPGPNDNDDKAPILTAIENCTLSERVSWVVPDGKWSDHPGRVGHDGGPSWVAAIVNAIGNSYANSNHACDYWGGNGLASEEPTAILIVWDDWGGFYDHVAPFRSDQGGGYINGEGTNYVYGFRVPFLVVSRYAQQYISNLNHDFGSILNFVEYVFGQGEHPLRTISEQYLYADGLVQDTDLQHTYSLWDFFDFGAPRSFSTIPGAKYPASCFHHPGNPGCFPSAADADPDDDAINDQD